MTSKINTNGIDITFPIPGINNSTQGFRDNFTAIKNNLDSASAEISDIQSKAVLKAGLSNTSLNNDMANAMISNVSLRGVRFATFNMGGSLQTDPDTVVIDVSRGDVQYASITGNTKIIFAGWSPSGTQSSLELHLWVGNNVVTNNSWLQFPNTLYGTDGKINYGMSATVRSLENYFSTYTGNSEPVTVTNNSDFAGLPDAARGITNSVTFPHGVREVKYKLTTRDCGQTIDIFPLNRPVQTTHIQMKYNSNVNSGAGTPGTNGINDGMGKLGDTKGQIATDGSMLFICTDDFVKDGVEAQTIVSGTRYTILTLGDTDWTSVMSSEDQPEAVGKTFNAIANGSPASGVEGTVQPAIWKYIDLNSFGS